MSEEAPKCRRFGPYVLLQRTGAGGMGRVDLALSARARGMQRLCVVKRIQAHLRNEEQEARFRREAGIAIGLSHGAIAQTLDVEEIEGELCILQEYIHGTTLSYLESRAASHETLPIPLSVHIVSEVARALAYAHSLPGPGLVHRDVTPDNIMVSFTGEVKLIDFGIAKVVGDSSLTQARMVVGRPIFTAPETLGGVEADHRSDLYSLGVVFWMLLTGRHFPDIFELGVAPAPSSLNPAVSPELDAISLRAIAIRPQDRCQSAEELLDGLAMLPGALAMHDRKVAGFLAKHFDVEEERRQLARDVAEARRLLDEQTTVTSPIQVNPVVSPPLSEPAVVGTTSLPARRQGTAHTSVAVISGAAAAAAVAWSLWHAPHRAPAPAPVCPAVTASSDSATVPPPAKPTRLQGQPPAASVVAAAPPLASLRGERRSSRRALRQPVSLASTTATQPEAAELLLDATTQLKAGAFDRAFGLANAAAQAGAGAPAHIIMGKVFFAKSDLPRAAAEFRKVAVMRPDDREAASFLEAIRKEGGGGP